MASTKTKHKNITGTKKESSRSDSDRQKKNLNQWNEVKPLTRISGGSSGNNKKNKARVLIRDYSEYKKIDGRENSLSDNELTSGTSD